MKNNNLRCIRIHFITFIFGILLLFLAAPGFAQMVMKNPQSGTCDVISGPSGYEVPPGGRICWNVTYISQGSMEKVQFLDDFNQPCSYIDCSTVTCSCPIGPKTCTPTNITINNIVVNGGVCETKFETPVDAGCALNTVIQNQAFIIYMVGGATFPSAPPPIGSSPAPTIVTVTNNAPVTLYAEKYGNDVNGGDLLPCEVVHYKVWMTNTGATSPNLEYSDPLPPEVGPATITSCFDLINPNACQYDSVQHRIFIPSYAPPADGARYSVVEYDVMTNCDLAQVTSLCNQGTFTDSVGATVLTDSDRNQGNGLQQTCKTVCLPVLSGLTKDVSDDNGPPLVSGDPLTFTITFSNTGCGWASGVVVTDDVDEIYFTNIDATLDGGMYDGNIITWNVGSVSPGQVVTLRFSATVQCPSGATISNKASATCSECGLSCATPCGIEGELGFVCNPGAQNHLFKNCCTAFPCDLVPLFPLPQSRSIADAPAMEPETGLGNTGTPLCFYQVESPAPGSCVKITKSTAAPPDPDVMEIYY
jgi:hypothetical protein